MGNGALAIGPKLPRPSSTLPQPPKADDTACPQLAKADAWTWWAAASRWQRAPAAVCFGVMPRRFPPRVLAWPVPKPPLLSPVMVPVMPHPDANWHEAVEARDRARAEESQRVLAYYAAQAQAREKREAAEARGVRGAPARSGRRRSGGDGRPHRPAIRVCTRATLPACCCGWRAHAPGKRSAPPPRCQTPLSTRPPAPRSARPACVSY
jgi:hypothetical protein